MLNLVKHEKSFITLGPGEGASFTFVGSPPGNWLAACIVDLTHDRSPGVPFLVVDTAAFS